MKASFALAALILLIGVTLGLRDRRTLSSLTVERDKLATEAAEFGIHIDPSDPESAAARTKRPRDDRDEQTRLISAEFIALMKEMQKVQQAGGQPDPEFQKKAMALMGKLMDLSPSQLKVFIDEIRNAEGLEDDMRQGLASFAIMMLAEESPQSALALFTESSDLLADSQMGGHVVAGALSRWAQEDPLGALEWVRKNAEKHPGIVTDEARKAIIDGAAKQDPKLAFQLLGELELKDPANAASVIIRSARTPEGRTASIEAMREHLATLPEGSAREDMRRNVLGSLAHTLRNEDFASATAWIEETLQPEELADFGDGLHYHDTKANSGEWVGWMARELPPEKMGGKVQNIVSQWTREDYKAAGTWLTQAPDDAAKAPAVRAYAETVAEYEPQTAEQWALTLPPGKDRQETLEAIHNRWSAKDVDARAAFARRYGIK